MDHRASGSCQKRFGSVGKNVDCNQRVIYDTESYIQDKGSGETVNIVRERGVYKFDGWVVAQKMVKTGKVELIDANGTKRSVKVDSKAGFSRQS